MQNIMLKENNQETKTSSTTPNNSMGIRGFDYVEFYVGSATMTTYWFQKALGLEVKAFKGPEHGTKGHISFYLEKNKLKFVITSAIQDAVSEYPDAKDIWSFVNKHGEGVKRFSYHVDDVEKAFNKAIENGATPISKPNTNKDDLGSVTEAAIRVYDDTEIVFINYDNYEGSFKPGFSEPVQNCDIRCEDTKLAAIDHIVGNVRENEMDKWADYFNNVLDFETYVHFGPGDISTKFSALLSKVVRSKDNIIKNPINEPHDGLKKSQIQDYIEQYNGSGVQHIAIITGNILESIKALRANGVEFLRVPATYYEELRKQQEKIDENVDDLEELGILCDLDKDGKGYLLQLFTKPIGDRPTFFFEIIQRKYGSESFGQGNFQSLFESIERDQERRGNL